LRKKKSRHIERKRDLTILLFLETRSRPTREREREREGFCNEALTVTDFGAEEWLYRV
jgi:hypothetical protein